MNLQENSGLVCFLACEPLILTKLGQSHGALLNSQTRLQSQGHPKSSCSSDLLSQELADLSSESFPTCCSINFGLLRPLGITFIG